VHLHPALFGVPQSQVPEIAKLEVSAQFLQVPNGWTQRSVYPARVDAELNQQDVVIFYDSSLNYQIETIETRHIDEGIDKSK
jgi:hypothetical protein